MSDANDLTPRMTLEELVANTKQCGYRDDAKSRDEWIRNASGERVVIGYLDEAAREAAGLENLPLCVKNGKHIWHERGFGVTHIIQSHGNQIAADGYDTVLDFLAITIEGIDELYANSKPGREHSRLIVRLGEPKRGLKTVLVLELFEGDGCFSIVTAFTRDEHRPISGTLLWKRG